MDRSKSRQKTLRSRLWRAITQNADGTPILGIQYTGPLVLVSAFVLIVLKLFSGD